MRKSRLLLAGVAVAAAAAATSAFTAGNDVQDSVAGYGTATVSGATTKHINYVLDADEDQGRRHRVRGERGPRCRRGTEGLKAWLQPGRPRLCRRLAGPVLLRCLCERRHSHHLHDHRHGDRQLRRRRTDGGRVTRPRTEAGRPIDRPAGSSRVSTP